MFRNLLAALLAVCCLATPAWAADQVPLKKATSGSGIPTVMATGDTVGVLHGGTGAATFTAHCVLIGETTSAFHIACPSSAGQVLTDNGAGSDPTFQASSASPGGSSGQLQYNNSGTFGGVPTVNGDGTLSTSTGALNVTKLNGVSPTYFFSGTDAANLTGTVACGRLPALTGDTTRSAGSCVTTTSQAAKWTTGRTLSITGDLAYISPSFDGSGNVTAAGTLATVNSNVGTFGDATHVVQFTVNAKGQITAASNVAITAAGTVTHTAGALAAHQLVIGNGSDDIKVLGAATNGQIPIGSTGADPVLATLASSDGSVVITNTAGAIDLKAAGGTGTVPHKYQAYGSLDAASGMTAVHVSNMTLTQGAISIQDGWTASASNTVQHYYESAPGSTPWDVYINFNFIASSTTNANDQFGLVVSNSSTGKLLLFSRSLGTVGLSVQEWTNATTFSSSLTSKTFGTNQTPQWLRIHSDGTTLTLYYSIDGSLWVQLTTRTIATFLSSVNAIGYGGVPFTVGEAWITNFGTTAPS
jgi:hypothetical protein